MRCATPYYVMAGACHGSVGCSLACSHKCTNMALCSCNLCCKQALASQQILIKNAWWCQGHYCPSAQTFHTPLPHLLDPSGIFLTT
jgi:hypothetical protein